MAMAKLPIFVKRDNEQGIVGGWQTAWIEIDQAAGAVVITPRGLLGGRWSITLRPDQLAAYQVQRVTDPPTSVGMQGGLLGQAIVRLMAQSNPMPVLNFQQPSGAAGERNVMVMAAGYLPRKLTRDIGRYVSALLTERGAKVMQPNLDDQETWKIPVAQIVIGVVIFVAIVSALCVCLAVVANLANS